MILLAGHALSDELKATVRIQRPANKQADGRGQSSCVQAAEAMDFELFSTIAVKNILASKDQAAIKAIEDAAESGDEGVLARNVATGLFEMVDDAALRAALDNDFSLPEQVSNADVTYEPAHDSEKSIGGLSLVGTLALRRILGKEEKEEPVVADTVESSCDPYNSS